jgi:hypothetical protein
MGSKCLSNLVATPYIFKHFHFSQTALPETSNVDFHVSTVPPNQHDSFHCPLFFNFLLSFYAVGGAPDVFGGLPPSIDVTFELGFCLYYPLLFSGDEPYSALLGTSEVDPRRALSSLNMWIPTCDKDKARPLFRESKTLGASWPPRDSPSGTQLPLGFHGATPPKSSMTRQHQLDAKTARLYIGDTKQP